MSAVFAVAVTQDQAPSAIALVALAPTLIFWGLDAYYLWNERLFRALYATRRAGPATARPASRTCRCST